MAYLLVRDRGSGKALEFETDEVQLGRDPSGEIIPEGEGSEVVSGRHARLIQLAGQWHLEDLGSSNGTFLDGQRVAPQQPVPVSPGAEVRLGQAGPRYTIERTAKAAVAKTLMEAPPVPAPLEGDATVPMEVLPPPVAGTPFHLGDDSDDTAQRSPPEMFLKVVDLRNGTHYQGRGGRLRLGRGKECEIRPLSEGDTVVSRVHAEITLTPGPTPRAVLMDAQSRNGTIVNGGRLAAPHDLAPGDRVELGRGGPELRVEELSLPGQSPQGIFATPAEDKPAVRAAAAAPARTPAASPVEPRRSFGGQGRTLFMREIVAVTNKSSRRLRMVVWSTVVLLVGTVSALLWWSEQRVRQTTAALVQQQESNRTEAQEDLARVRQELEVARNSSAPSAVLDSLREALDLATARTLALEQSLQRAQTEVTAQLADAERLRAQRESELQRMQRQFQQASNSDVSRQLLDSLRRAISSAEQQVNNIDGQVRAVRGSNLAGVAQDNQGAVGLVSAYIKGQMYSGTGFIVSASGYFITNRHVVYQDGQADSVFVTMADNPAQTRARAAIVRIPGTPAPDLAILRVAGYSGSAMRKIDWSGTRARQGEPAALIGFPSGFQIAVDPSGFVRTSFSAGVFSMVTTDRIQFDGFTVGGSSGSPIFNATGEVVAVHRAGLRGQTGLAFAEPIHKAIELLPAALRSELGLPGN